MPITLKKDVWKVKDPSSGQYRGAAILSTTLPQDAAQIISESNTAIQNIKDTAIEAVDTALNNESTGLIPKAEADRDAIDDSLNNATNGIIPTAQSDRDDIDDSLNNINDGIIPEAQANLATIAAAVQSQIGQGTDKTLSVAKGFADAKAAGMLVKVSNYQPGSQLDDPATSQDASQNTGYPVYKDSNRVWVKETYAELEVPTMDDVDELKSAINVLDGYFGEGKNLFNPNDPDLLIDYKLKNDGTTIAEIGKIVSGYIPVRAGQTVCVNYPTSIYGGSSSLVLYDANKQRLTYVNPSRYTDARGNGYLKYTFSENSEAVYFRATGTVAGLPIYMCVYANEMPSTYIPYTDKVTLADDVVVPFESIESVSVSKDDTDFIKASPRNLVDLSALVPGILTNSSSNGDIDTSGNYGTNWVTTDYISVEPGATYAMCIFPGVNYGAGFLGIPYYDENHIFLGRVKQAGGSVASIASRVTITLPNRAEIKYIRASYYKSYTDATGSGHKRWWETQIFKASAWPGDLYVPFDDSDQIIEVRLDNIFSGKYNPLWGKSALWNGDSICAADSDTGAGWPGRIATANGMIYKNYGISGGTIAENTGSDVHSVSATLDRMFIDFPNADYIIIEGGTNDADLLGDNGIGIFDPDDFTETYINALDKNTFSGALESIFYRLVTQMKGKHIGYLIPQKMGHTEVLVARRRVYFDRAKAIAQKWGIPVLDLWNDLYFNWRLSAHWDQTMTTAENEAAGNLYIDGQHLTTTGYAVEAPVIAEWMKSI